jgi:hypothetical protein
MLLLLNKGNHPMDHLIAELRAYLFETLGIKVHFRPWKGQGGLPIFLTNAYKFQECSVLGQPCLFMLPVEIARHTPGNIGKLWVQVSSRYVGITVYVQPTISAYDRKRLIGQKIPFIVPGKQMYLPEMGVELREHFQTLHSDENQYLSPAAHAVLIYALLGKMGEKSTLSALAKALGYTRMTMSRVFDELAVAGIGEILKVAKERWWLPFCTKNELWQQAKSKMRSPVKQHIWIKKAPQSMKPNILSGLSALSHYSLLNPPSLPTYAIHKTMWTSWKNKGVEESPYLQEALFELQIWHYNPSLFSDKNIVDPFSLYLSLENTNDERVEIALDEMMRNIIW